MTEIFIHSSQHLNHVRGELEDDLEDFLGCAGEVTGGGGGDRGWSIDLEICEGESLENWIPKLVVLLRRLEVPSDTCLTVSVGLGESEQETQYRVYEHETGGA